MTSPILRGYCIDAMRTMPDQSVDAIVTDPPYGLEFMGKQWDDLPPGIPWAREALRVLKPGGFLLAFGGTRTSHRLACAIEDAGFEIRDTIAWLYGSGFPKSLDVSKAIDKAAGATREIVGPAQAARRNRNSERFATKYGAHDGAAEVPLTAPATPAAEQWDGWGTALKPAHEPIVVARKPLTGTVAANVLEHGTGAINVDACRIEPRDRTDYGPENATRTQGATYGEPSASADFDASQGRWPSNVILDPEAAAILDEQTGDLHSQDPATRNSCSPRSGLIGFADGGINYADRGGASRFFYVAKASRAERNAGLDDRNTHPTVKPIELMRWLVRLVTPPNGTVLDPFAGSGTTGIAAALEGVRSVGIERDEEYAAIADARIAWWAARAGTGSTVKEILKQAKRDQRVA